MATVRLPASLRRYAGGLERHEVPAATAGEALRLVAERHPDLVERLFDGSGRIRSHLSVVVGDRVLPGGGPAFPIGDGDEVVVLVALAGGAALRYR
jgi:molybdopterin converting factor small subunit